MIEVDYDNNAIAGVVTYKIESVSDIKDSIGVEEQNVLVLFECPNFFHCGDVPLGNPIAGVNRSFRRIDSNIGQTRDHAAATNKHGGCSDSQQP